VQLDSAKWCGINDEDGQTFGGSGLPQLALKWQIIVKFFAIKFQIKKYIWDEIARL